VLQAYPQSGPFDSEAYSRAVLDGQPHHRACVAGPCGRPWQARRQAPGSPPEHMWPREPIREREVKRPTITDAGGH
jgi:hypothetical protein